MRGLWVINDRQVGVTEIQGIKLSRKLHYIVRKWRIA